jgi:PIN domain nuclease of toxin-antitoxin system
MILLDTHIVLAILGQTDVVLSSQMENLLQQDKGLYVSVATIWEVAIKHRIGKLALSIDIQELSALLGDINIGVLSIQSSHALASIGPEPITKDPFDRLLLGVCVVEGMKLLTIDRALVAHPLAWW